MRKLFMLLSMFMIVAQSFAQNRTITGKVTDDKGAPLVGVTIRGGSAAATTDASGNYTLRLPSSVKSLSFNYVGYSTSNKDINGNTINVSLAPENTALSEVVVVGYGTQKRADVTGSVSVVKAADIENKPFSSIDKALQGQVAGLQSITGSGQPGSSQSIIIRGSSSITASNSPLWVIDGVPINSGDATRLQTTGNLLSTLNPNDVESISVLKDAASQSIYGSRAANGVIVVTTKKGKAGKTRFRFDTEIGSSNTAYENSKYRPLNAAEYIALTKEGLTNLGVNQATMDATVASLGGNSGNDFNWYDAVTRTGTQQQYNLSVDGGNDKTTFYVSGGHFIQEGTAVSSILKRTSGNIRLTHKATDRLTLNLNMNGGFSDQKGLLNGSSFGNPVMESFFMIPTRSPYNADGSWNYNMGGLHNVVALTQIDKRLLRQTSLRGSIFGEYRILDNLKFKSTLGSDYNVLEEDLYNNPFHGDGFASNGRAYSYYTRYFNYVWTNTLDLNQSLLKSGDLMLNAQVGYESQKSNGYQSSLQNQQFPPTLALTFPASGASPTTASAQIMEYTFNSMFASANFNFKNRYVVSGSFRRDGSSRFGPNNRYGNFWAVGGSWNVDKEKFMENVRSISQLKLRASYGVNGNAGIGNYDWAPSYNFNANYNQLPGSSPGNVGDSSLTWELNKPLDIGMDVSFLKNRINFSVDWYKRKSEGLLLGVQLSRTSGFTTTTRNTGTMENTGVEMTLNAVPVRTKNFDWTVDFNFATNKNTVTSLPGGADIADPNQATQLIRQGEAYRSFFLREYAGVDPANGDPLWYTDATHKTTTNVYPAASTRAIVGNAAPKYFGSFTNSFNFKGFSLEAQFYYNFGNYIYDTWGGYYLGSGFGAVYNKVARQLDRWTTPGQVTDIPKYVYNGNKSFQSGSSFYLNKGDFIRLRNVQLGYTLPKNLISKAKINNAFFYVRGTNLWTWVKDKNLPFDPEQGVSSVANFNVLIPKTITAGLNLTF
jgi:TonB-linked SusC/RagA family outer membrane protein